MNTFKKHISQILVHLLFWILFSFISLFVFSKYYWSENPFLQYLVILVIIVYTNNIVLLPFFMKRKWYLLYAIIFISISFFATQLYCNVFTKCDCTIMKCLSDYLWQTIVPLTFFSFIWVLFQYLDREKEIETTQQEKTALELKLLKSQINPHVLFNNLNTIYSYAIEKPDETPSLILKLSDNLKHVLYESNSDYISLEKELQYIDNYISFQKIRTQGIKTIEYSQEVTNVSKYTIAPLLLITLIENAFKHSTPYSTITIDIQLENNILQLYCKNSFINKEKHRDNSIGLQNLRKRLNLLYTNTYSLTIEKSTDFVVILKLELT